MKAKRFGLLAKIILFTGILTILTVASSLTASAAISYNNTKKSYIESCEYVTDNMESVLFHEEAKETTSNLLGEMITKYSEVRDDYETIDKVAYQEDLSAHLFGAKGGAIGLSRDQGARRSFYIDSLSKMQTFCSDYKLPFASLNLYDREKERIIIVANSDIAYDANLDTIGLAEEHISNEEIEIFNSTYGGKTFDTYVTKDFVKSFNLIDISLGDPNYQFFIRGWYPLDEFNATFSKQIGTQLIVTVASAIFLVIVYAIFTKFFLIKNVEKLTKSTNEFVGKMKNDENLSIVESEVKTSDEIKELSDAFTLMQSQIITYVDNIKEAQDKERAFDAEVNVASKIQLESLPAETYFDRNLELRAFIKPAKGVGGDFYDYFYIDQDHLAFVIGDVSGKGIPASLFMMRSKESIRSATLNERDLSKVFQKVNNSLCINNKEGYFVTAFLGVLDLKTHEFAFVNAGHERPFLTRNGESKRIEVESNFVLGLEEDFTYKTEKIQLQEDDSIVLYTDGLNEAINAEKEEFGYERIALSLQKEGELKDTISTTLKDLEEFEGVEEQFDDITLLSFKLKKNVITYNYLNPTYEDIGDLTDKVEAYLENLDPKTLSKIGVVIDEVMNNIISYGKTKTNKTLMVSIEKTGDGATLIFMDNSHPFNPLLKEKRTVQENMEEGIVGGLGISIVKSIAKEAEYAYSNNKNILIIKF